MIRGCRAATELGIVEAGDRRGWGSSRLGIVEAGDRRGCLLRSLAAARGPADDTTGGRPVDRTPSARTLMSTGVPVKSLYSPPYDAEEPLPGFPGRGS